MRPTWCVCVCLLSALHCHPLRSPHSGSHHLFPRLYINITFFKICLNHTHAQKYADKCQFWVSLVSAKEKIIKMNANVGDNRKEGILNWTLTGACIICLRMIIAEQSFNFFCCTWANTHTHTHLLACFFIVRIVGNRDISLAFGSFISLFPSLM